MTMTPPSNKRGWLGIKERMRVWFAHLEGFLEGLMAASGYDEERLRRQLIDLTNLLVGTFVSLIAFLYLVTSAVVVINAFVWLPTFPAFWYDVQRIIYWPWQPYFALAYALSGCATMASSPALRWNLVTSPSLSPMRSGNALWLISGNWATPM